MTRINLLGHQFLYIAHDRCMMASHFDWLIRLRLVIIVRRGGSYSLLVTRKVGLRTIVEN